MDPIVLTNYREATRFASERFSPVSLGETERIKVVLTCFEAGQFIPVHAPGVDMTLVILEGDGRVTAGQQEYDVSTGAIIIVPAGQMRGVRASTRMVAVHVVSPPPTESDHAAVQAGLRQSTRV